MLGVRRPRADAGLRIGEAKPRAAQSDEAHASWRWRIHHERELSSAMPRSPRPRNDNLGGRAGCVGATRDGEVDDGRRVISARAEQRAVTRRRRPRCRRQPPGADRPARTLTSEPSPPPRRAEARAGRKGRDRSRGPGVWTSRQDRYHGANGYRVALPEAPTCSSRRRKACA